MRDNLEKEANYTYKMLEEDFVICKKQFVEESGLIPKGKELFVFIDRENKDEKFTPYVTPLVGEKQFKMIIPEDYLKAIFSFVKNDVIPYSQEFLPENVEVSRIFANSILYSSFLHEFSHFIRNHHSKLKPSKQNTTNDLKVIEIDADVIAACLLFSFISTTGLSRGLLIKSVIVGIRGQFEIVHRYFTNHNLTSSYELEPISRAYIALCNMATAPTFENDLELEKDISNELQDMENKLFKNSWINATGKMEPRFDSNLWHQSKESLSEYAHSDFEQTVWTSVVNAKFRRFISSIKRVVYNFIN
ncbi:hypothetical protein [Vibrio alginolyticus]|uniref:Uncharacterized protein n=1 Tax=Vibrio alginolyticus TaxID=663 RepID=A0A7Y4AZJ2_VIBAL|nr:hypothetical protein [Vibrio alginolyticus]NOI07371.1 hypothetical protein [Vibrio alginolyticus]